MGLEAIARAVDVALEFLTLAVDAALDVTDLDVAVAALAVAVTSDVFVVNHPAIKAG